MLGSPTGRTIARAVSTTFPVKSGSREGRALLARVRESRLNVLTVFLGIEPTERWIWERMSRSLLVRSVFYSTMVVGIALTTSAFGEDACRKLS